MGFRGGRWFKRERRRGLGSKPQFSMWGCGSRRSKLSGPGLHSLQVRGLRETSKQGASDQDK